MANDKTRIIPVVLCGGQGTRLWPLSRSGWPKQFLPLVGAKSLFQQTLARVSDETRFAPPIVITNQAYRFIVAEQAQELGVTLGAVLLEPVARNTAAAIAAATVYAREQAAGSDDQLILVLPSDHLLTDDDVYRTCLAVAAEAARAGNLVTFGIQPTEPATGFGYIEAGAAIAEGAHKVKRFVEKPPLSDAEAMIAAGGFYWNSGMFLFRAGDLISEGTLHAPEVVEAAARAVDASYADLDFVRLDADAFAAAPNISIDYAVFERTSRAAVVPANIVWSDLGSWDAVWKASEKDASSNVSRGPTFISNTQSSLVLSEGAHVTVEGLEDVAVIVSADAVFVGRLSAAQNVGAIVKALAANAQTAKLTEQHLTSYRPWGGYTSLLIGERFQVKRLFVKPGKQLSLQKHRHRAEHWVVVRGTAEATVGDRVHTLNENEFDLYPARRRASPGQSRQDAA